MIVKVKFHDIICETESATMFLFSEKEVWIPKKLFKFWRGGNITMPLWLAEEKGLKFSQIMHIPDKIDPVPNQKPIEDLIYENR